MLRHIKPIDIHGFMYDRFQPDEHTKRFASFVAEVDGSKKLGSSAKLVKVKTLNALPSLNNIA